MVSYEDSVEELERAGGAEPYLGHRRQLHRHGLAVKRRRASVRSQAELLLSAKMATATVNF